MATVELVEDSRSPRSIQPESNLPEDQNKLGVINHRNVEHINYDEQLVRWGQIATIGTAAFSVIFLSTPVTLLGGALGVAVIMYLTPKNEEKLLESLYKLVPGLEDPTTGRLALAATVSLSLFFFFSLTAGFAGGDILGKQFNENEGAIDLS